MMGSGVRITYPAPFFLPEKSSLRYSSGYKKTENWEKTNLILFKNGETFFETGGEIKLYKNVLVDIRQCKESIQFSDLFSKYYWEYEKKYAPTKELFEVYGGFEIELSEYLSARNLYPEILKKYNIKPKEKQEKMENFGVNQDILDFDQLIRIIELI